MKKINGCQNLEKEGVCIGRNDSVIKRLKWWVLYENSRKNHVFFRIKPWKEEIWKDFYLVIFLWASLGVTPTTNRKRKLKGDDERSVESGAVWGWVIELVRKRLFLKEPKETFTFELMCFPCLKKERKKYILNYWKWKNTKIVLSGFLLASKG